jgi:hypothetical protein
MLEENGQVDRPASLATAARLGMAQRLLQNGCPLMQLHCSSEVSRQLTLFDRVEPVDGAGGAAVIV